MKFILSSCFWKYVQFLFIFEFRLYIRSCFTIFIISKNNQFHRFNIILHFNCRFLLYCMETHLQKILNKKKFQNTCKNLIKDSKIYFQFQKRILLLFIKKRKKNKKIFVESLLKFLQNR